MRTSHALLCTHQECDGFHNYNDYCNICGDLVTKSGRKPLASEIKRTDYCNWTLSDRYEKKLRYLIKKEKKQNDR